MTVRSLCTFKEDVLREDMSEVQEITDELLDFIDDMEETMYVHNGVGLAAPQVGRSIQVAVLDCSTSRDGSEMIRMMNPEIIDAEGEREDVEGCLSLPGIWEDLVRPASVKVRFLTPEGEWKTLQREDLWARCFRHEVDHLRGTLFIDHLEGDTRERAEERFERLSAWAEHPEPIYREKGKTWEAFTKTESRLVDLNVEHFDNITIPRAYESFFAELSGPVNFAVVTELISYDSAWILPLIAQLEDRFPSINLRIFTVEEAPDLADYYRTYSRGVHPVVVGFDGSFEEKFIWGPRPAEGDRMLEDLSDDATRREFKNRLEQYYSTGGTMDVLEELKQKVETEVLHVVEE